MEADLDGDTVLTRNKKKTRYAGKDLGSSWRYSGTCPLLLMNDVAIRMKLSFINENYVRESI